MEHDARLNPAHALPPAGADSAQSGLLRALPDGWVMLGRCRCGTAGPASYPTGCYALAHPGMGVALLDVVPDATPNAEARLRRTLGQADFWASFPGVLPVWHGRIELSAWRAVPGIVAEGFSELLPLTVAGGGAWIAAARWALAQDAAWEVPGAAAEVAPEPGFGEAEDDPPPAPRLRARRLVLPVGFAVTFVLGLASGAMLLSGGDLLPPPASASLAAMPGPAQAAATTQPSTEPARELPAEPPPALPEAAVVPGQVAAAQAVAPPAPAQPPMATQAAGETGTEAPEPVQSLAALLPLPPALPRHPVQKVAKPPQIDKACSRALYRFQQGEVISLADQAYLRDGCATRR